MLSLLAGCGSSEEASESQPAAPAVESPPSAQDDEATVSTADDEEACAQILIISHDEATPKPEGVDRTELQARERAEALWTRLEAGESFEELARAESDGASTGARGGLMGTYARGEWPQVHEAIRDPLFVLGVGQVSRPVRAAYGWTLVKRCLVEKAHVRHLLVRYAGARNADESVTRDRTEADRLAHEYHERATAEGADFQAIAREVSEDGSAEQGGDLGSLGRGLLAQPVDDAAFALEPGQISDVVESPFGFHVIQRVE